MTTQAKVSDLLNDIAHKAERIAVLLRELAALRNRPDIDWFERIYVTDSEYAQLEDAVGQHEGFRLAGPNPDGEFHLFGSNYGAVIVSWMA